MILNKHFISQTLYFIKAEKQDRIKAMDKIAESSEEVIRVKLLVSNFKLNLHVNILKLTIKRRRLSPDASSKDKFSIQPEP